MINVTKPFLPPQERYEAYINDIWSRNWLTNNGPLVQQLEIGLEKYLGVNNLLFLNNGTIALQIAIKALALKGEVITTPFSYVATTSSIVWENCTPVFVDIDKASFNIDASKIEAAITPQTSGILVTHVFGNPCDVEALQAIADKHQLKLIYDAAHCFGVKYKGKSLLEYGDISTISFHATKLYHTIEGGAVITKSEELKEKMSYLRNFGHGGNYNYEGVGINGKNSEFHAAMGLANLEYADEILAKRKELYLLYKEKLQGANLQFQQITDNTDYNYAYFPVVFKDEDTLLATQKRLTAQNIHARRYFYPSLHHLPYVASKSLPIAEKISTSILCLPFYHTLSKFVIDRLCDIVLETHPKLVYATPRMNPVRYKRS